MRLKYALLARYATRTDDGEFLAVHITDTFISTVIPAEASRSTKEQFKVPPFYFVAELHANATEIETSNVDIVLSNADGVVGGKFLNESFTWELGLDDLYTGKIAAPVQGLVLPSHGKYVFQILDQIKLLGVVPFSLVPQP